MVLFSKQVSPEEEKVFEEIEALLGENSSDSNSIAKFRFPTENAVESLRYRAEVYDILFWL